MKFTAQVSDEYNDLVSFQLLVTMDGAEILNLSKGLSGVLQLLKRKLLYLLLPVSRMDVLW